MHNINLGSISNLQASFWLFFWQLIFDAILQAIILNVCRMQSGVNVPTKRMGTNLDDLCEPCEMCLDDWYEDKSL